MLQVLFSEYLLAILITGDVLLDSLIMSKSYNCVINVI
jgi:hypothetical protein